MLHFDQVASDDASRDEKGEIMGSHTTVALIKALHPTQLTLGMDHVRQKMDASRAHMATFQAFMERHPIKAVLGPNGQLYIIDHHHWARAWLELGKERTPIVVVRDLHKLGKSAFWRRMSELGDVHPYDEQGVHRAISALPPTVEGMIDDPYRSLAAFARNAGGYRKPKCAYADFQWAAFFRKHVKGDLHTIHGFAQALANATRLARSRTARKLPGYLGA
ncbi:ParB/Srx family N-terminal domain-containing protein [Cupriavidus basilensis]|nr:ParB/Srx family N-terminal domain-containing protein [Cupriavidus basilensis]